MSNWMCVKHGEAEWFREANAADMLRAYGTETKRCTTEDRFDELLRRAGVHGYNRQFTIRINGQRFRSDFAFPVAKVIVEIDGEHHRYIRDQDYERDRLLLGHGWVTLRYSVGDIHERGEQVVSEVLNIVTGNRWKSI